MCRHWECQLPLGRKGPSQGSAQLLIWPHFLPFSRQSGTEAEARSRCVTKAADVKTHETMEKRGWAQWPEELDVNLTALFPSTCLWHFHDRGEGQSVLHRLAH